MTELEFNLIPAIQRRPRFHETKDEDLILYCVKRLTMVSIAKLKSSVVLEFSIPRDQLVFRTKSMDDDYILLDIHEQLSIIGVTIESITTQYLKIGLNDFFSRIY